MVLREVTYLQIVLRILAAVIFGGILGMERGLKNRAAGLRTYMLVCVGSCLIMLTNQYLYQLTESGDPMRLGAQVVSGIGFLGAGTIIVTKHNQIKGLTTAAGLWASAGVGLALGVGFYEAAMVAGVLIFVILTVMQRWDDRMHRRARLLELYIELSEASSIASLMKNLRALDLSIESVETESDTILDDGMRPLIVTLKTKKRGDHSDLLRQIRSIEGICHLEEL